MHIARFASAFVAGAVVLSGALAAVSGAVAADLPSRKAPLLAAPEPTLDIHGFADFTIASTRVTPGGLLIYPSNGALMQTQTGLSFDIYKNKGAFINSFTVFGGVWSESWTAPPVGTRHWQEFDWWAGASVGFADYWKLSAQILQFKFPGGPTDENFVFSLSYDDSHFGWPITINPYVNLFYNNSGPSTVVFGKNGGTYRFEVGMVPTLDLKKTTGVPLSLSAPTWITFGPTDYWNREDATTRRCGPLGTSACATSSAGVISTGLQAKYSLEQIIPKRLGNWYVKGGVQYYHIMNDALRAAQVATGAAPNFAASKTDAFVFSTGIGVSF